MTSLDQSTLEAIRPDVTRLDAAWSAATLESILAAPSRERARRRRRLGYAAGGLAGALVLGGGVAYASGNVPSFVSDFAHLGAANAGNGSATPDMQQIVDRTLPDGTRFAVWRGRSDTLECTVEVSGWDGREYPGDGGAACGPALIDGRDANNYQLVWAGRQPGGTAYPVLYGDTDTGATQVRVSGTLNLTGLAVDATVAVDPTSHGFSLLLPGATSTPRSATDPRLPSGLTLTFLDAQGRTVATGTLGS